MIAGQEIKQRTQNKLCVCVCGHLFLNRSKLKKDRKKCFCLCRLLIFDKLYFPNQSADACVCVCVCKQECVGWPFSSRMMNEMNEHSLFHRPLSVSDHFDVCDFLHIRFSYFLGLSVNVVLMVALEERSGSHSEVIVIRNHLTGNFMNICPCLILLEV